MKKQITAMLLVSAMAASMCACGSSAASAGSTESTGTEAEETLTTEDSTEAAGVVDSSITYDGPSSCEIGLDYAANLTRLADYDPIAITIDKSYEVTEDAENTFLCQMLTYYGVTSTVEVTDHDTVQEDDYVDVDYTGYLDGESFTGDEAANDVIDVATNSNISGSSFIDGFSELLVGAKVGETISKEITFPDPYTSNTDLSGKTTTFEFTINSIVEPVTFDTLTDETVSEAFSGYSVNTVDDMKSVVDSQLEYQLYQEEVTVVKEALLNASTVTVPEDYLTARVWEYAKAYETMYCSGTNLENYLSDNYGITLDDYISQVTDALEEQISYEIIFGTIAEKEGMEVDEDEYNSYIEYYIENTSLGFTDTEGLYEYYGSGDLAAGEEFMRKQYLVNTAIDTVVGDAEVSYE